MKFRRVCVLILLITIITSSCSTKNPIVLSNQCKAPCWRQIEPGKTTAEEALKLIQSFPDLNNKSVSLSDSWNIFSGFVGFKLKTGEVIRVYSIDNNVVSITFESSTGLLTVGDLISEFGEPTYIYPENILGSGPLIIPASDSLHLWINLIYPKKGISVSYDSNDSYLFPDKSITKETKIKYLEYFDVNQYDQLFKLEYGSDYEDKSIKELLYPWKGYGNVEELYPIP